ncbi:hypothetical protein PQG44_09005 [Aquirufa sp. LEPPI-3A]|uniref:hypothetical protein n=1 Tax=Aquirufa regiilacus TaxID=3024868 RepID=UPI0028DEB076|nr:hypothetical protein [Aquirufa sp. LEPPI-3A]MDT8887814.1 hypothetical protein [Aquirufa sp. LEPPI-3A]
MEFEEYYQTLFFQHLNCFIDRIPESSKYHDDPERKEIITIQRSRLTSKYGYLNFLNKEEKIHFIVSLYFVILFDMVFYTHYKLDYIKFQTLTKYPKFIGDCLQQCRFHLNPIEVFNSIDVKFNFKSRIIESAPFVRDEVSCLIKDNFPEIDLIKFWKYCLENLPT